MYDSAVDTMKHMERVAFFISKVISELRKRIDGHDQSKLRDPEKSSFDEYTPKLKDTTYGSDEYRAFLREMSGSVRHHYVNNRHHPEHFPNGINGMNLIDLIEMLCDWKAATERHDNGDMLKSLEINKERFGISDQLIQIMKNTVEGMGWTSSQ